MNLVRWSYIELHIAVLLFGFTAILGKLILLSALIIVWWRVLLTSGSLLFFKKVRNQLGQISRRMIFIYSLIGLLVGLHWLTFYGSIKLANASVALISFATTSLFTSILEPYILKRPFSFLELGLGLLIVPGMYLIVDTLAGDLFIGFMVGILSALLATSFTILNKKYIKGADPRTITFVELTSAFILMSAIVPFEYARNPDLIFWPSGEDWIYLLILALLCTTLAYVLALRSLRHLSAFASNIAINLEPVYGILMALVIFKEHHELSPNFYLGVVLIMAIVLGHPFLTKRFSL
jgi:drug/metabolite transporter (DMT)-like permease